MSRRVQVENWSRAIARSIGGFRRDSYTDPQGRTSHSLEGVTTTPFGFVYAYSVWDEADPGKDQTRIEFVWREREHVRQLNRAYTNRGLATLAARFAREIAQGGAR